MALHLRLRTFFIASYAVIAAMCSHVYAFTPEKGIVVLDMTERNGEDETKGDYCRQLYSAQYMCDIAGYPYFTTSDINEALGTDGTILLSSNITSKSFTAAEYEAILQWVIDGGVILSPAIRSSATPEQPYVSQLFGIDASALGVSSKDRTLIEWNPEFYDDEELAYFDEPEERTTSLGTMRTFNIPATDADVLALYPNGDAAVTRHRIGKGAVYLTGILWRDAVQRSQLNKDFSGASRHYNNGFEPSADIWALFLRSIVAANTPASVWKFTVPGGFTQLLIPTHDCDSRTAYEAMHHMGRYEKSLKMNGHYFITTHYFSDKEVFGHSYLSNFYNDKTIPEVEALLAEGHTIGSHSICHFPDFNKVRNMDVVTKEEYAQRATCEDGTSRGASTWAEIVLSKNIIEEDLGNHVRSFRSGHLCTNPDIPTALMMGDYEFASCYTAGDLLSQFPFYTRENNDWSGELTDILQMPLHLSDVYSSKDEGGSINDDNWQTHPAVDQWEEAMRKLHGNYASAILLIHPNREWKMTIQKQLVERLDLSTVGCYNFEEYGDFWKSRLTIPFDYSYNPESGVMTITTDLDEMERHGMTFAVESKDNVTKAVIQDINSGKTEECDLIEIAPGRYITRQAPPVSAINTVSTDNDKKLNVTVNNGMLMVNTTGLVNIYNLTGACVLSKTLTADSGTINISHLPNGIYVVTSASMGSTTIAKN